MRRFIESLKDGSRGHAEARFGGLLAETLAYGLHVADRAVFDRVGPQGRDTFMDGAEAGTAEAIGLCFPDEARPKAVEEFLALVQERSGEYSLLHDSFDVSNGARNDLHWQFSKRFAEAADPSGKPGGELQMIALVHFMPTTLEDIRQLGSLFPAKVRASAVAPGSMGDAR